MHTRFAGMISAAIVTAVALAVMPTPALGAEAHSGPVPLAAQVDDLKTDCANHPTEAASPRGWARSRFELCHHYEQTVNLYRIPTNQYLGKIEYELWVLGFAYDGSRRVDYVISMEDVGISTQLNAYLGYLTVTMSGCQTTTTSCVGSLTRADNIPGWFTTPTMATVSGISPNDTGNGTHFTVGMLASFEVLVEYRDGSTLPYVENRALNSVRFDSAGANLGNGKFHGTVFVDYVPTLELSMRPGSDHLQEARHVNDAFHHPQWTFPSHIGKSVPGRDTSRPLHRLMDATKRGQNHNASVAICEDVWGPDYAAGGLQCDEFPFQSTYEGSYTSTIGAGASDTDEWHGSARPINGADNQQGGTKLANFYGLNRILDNDPFLVTVLT